MKPRDPQALTARQQEVYDWIVDYQSLCGRPPSYREIMRHFHMRSPNGVACHLEALEKKGVITERKGFRAIHVSDPLAVLERQIKRLTKSQRAELRRRMG